MAAPDKIYIDEDLIAFHILNEKFEEDIEYIRKDALLEWAEKKKEELLNDEPTDVAAGLNAGFDMIINKLNEM